MATEEDVANVIFEAAIDGTDQLRYVATEDIKPLLAAEKRNLGSGIYQVYKRAVGQCSRGAADPQHRLKERLNAAETMPGQEVQASE